MKQYIIYKGSIYTVPEGMSKTEFAKQLREELAD